MERGDRRVPTCAPADKLGMDGFGQDQLHFAEGCTARLQGSQHRNDAGKSHVNRSCAALNLLVIQGKGTREESSSHRGNFSSVLGFAMVPPESMEAGSGVALGVTPHLMRM